MDFREPELLGVCPTAQASLQPLVGRAARLEAAWAAMQECKPEPGDLVVRSHKQSRGRKRRNGGVVPTPEARARRRTPRSSTS